MKYSSKQFILKLVRTNTVNRTARNPVGCRRVNSQTDSQEKLTVAHYKNVKQIDIGKSGP